MGKWSAATRRKFQATIKKRRAEFGVGQALHKGYGGGPKTAPKLHFGGNSTARKGKEEAPEPAIGKPLWAQGSTLDYFSDLLVGAMRKEIVEIAADPALRKRLVQALVSLLASLTA